MTDDARDPELDAILRTLEADHGTAVAEAARQLLDTHGEFTGRAPTDWTAESLERLLLREYPGQVVVAEADVDVVPSAASALLRALGFDELADHALDLAALFGERMRDPAAWSMGKRLMQAALADGADPEDPDAMDAWLAAFNERSETARAQVLGPLPGEAVPGPQPRPPVIDLPDDELLAAAEASLLLQRVGRLVEFVGEGRPVTDEGVLPADDAAALVDVLGVVDPEWVDLVFQLALELEQLELLGARVVPIVHDEEAGPLELFLAALVVLLTDYGPAVHWFEETEEDHEGLATDVDESLVYVLGDLLSADAPRRVDDTAGLLWAELRGFDEPETPEDLITPEEEAWNDIELDLVDAMVRQAFAVFADLGVVHLHAGAFEGAEAVSLTPIGAWSVGRLLTLLEQEATEAYVPQLSELSAVELLGRIWDVEDPDDAAAEVEAWIEVRGLEAAMAELCAALPAVDDPSRGLVVRTLLVFGPVSRLAMAAVPDTPELAPFVLLHRAEFEEDVPAELDCAGDPERWVRLVSAALHVWDDAVPVIAVAHHAAGDPGLPAMLDIAWRVRGRATGDVLELLGSVHPDKATAKAARRARHKHESSAR
jgi:hypothetical protein